MTCFDKRNGHLFHNFHGVVTYFWWNEWKERNRRTFNGVYKSAEEVTFLTKEDIQQFSLAHKNNRQYLRFA